MLAERYEQRRYQEGKAEGKAEGRVEGVAAVLDVLDDKTRKEVERKLRLNRHPENRG